MFRVSMLLSSLILISTLIPPEASAERADRSWIVQNLCTPKSVCETLPSGWGASCARIPPLIPGIDVHGKRDFVRGPACACPCDPISYDTYFNEKQQYATIVAGPDFSSLVTPNFNAVDNALANSRITDQQLDGVREGSSLFEVSQTFTRPGSGLRKYEIDGNLHEHFIWTAPGQEVEIEFVNGLLQNRLINLTELREGVQ